MNQTLAFLVRYGAAFLFAALFIDQMGLPVPAQPVLLAGGAMVGAGKMSLLPALGAGILGSLVADMIWFYLGRYRGQQVLNLMCRISIVPDSCVRKTQDVFARYGMRTVVVSKFIPGVSTLAPPLAGGSGVGALRFLFFDTIAALLYVGGYMLLGYLFSAQVQWILDALANLGFAAVVVVVGAVALYILYKFVQRRRLLRKLRMARITVDEVYRRQQEGEALVILDVRSRSELQRTPGVIRGARHVTFVEMEAGQVEVPQDRDVILYCSCPNEVTSAKAALILKRHGIVRVRPLLGGIDAWRQRQYPMDLNPLAPAPGSTPGNAGATGVAATPSV